MLTIQDLHFSRQDGAQIRPILTGLNLTLGAGAQCSLVGDSGTGKTTLLSLIAGLECCQSGCIELDAWSLQGRSVKELALYRRQIGIIFQDFQLLASLNVRDNILFPYRLLGHHDQPKMLARLTNELGIATLLERYPHQLSGGEQQRVAVCRALIHQPKLVLADEPTGNLDENNSQQVVAQLSQLAQEQGTTVIMVTHSQKLAAGFDRQLRLHNGQLWQGEQPC